MIYIYFLIILLLVILVTFLRTYELFSNNNTLMNSACMFKPVEPDLSRNDSKTDCLIKCKKTINCSNEVSPGFCDTLCNTCETEECTWNNDDRLKPKAMNIKVLPYNEKARIIWRPYNYNSSLTGKGQITNYIIVVEKLSDKNARRVSLWNNSNCKECSYDVTGLKNQEAYKIAIRAKNNYGIGPYSNFETVIPVGPKRIYDISQTILESDEELSMNIDDDIKYSDTSCGKSAKYLNNNHILSKDYDNLFDFINQI